MKPSNGNVAVVARLYEARGNLEVIRQVLAPDVRWEVVEGLSPQRLLSRTQRRIRFLHASVL
jgi:hypothetical protein